MTFKGYTAQDIEQLGKVDRLNLINSCTGYKSANLIGTIGKEGELNVTVFSSITHLGSNPALLGFILRPTTVPRDTYRNLKETGYCTVNHITAAQFEAAHHSSSSYDYGISEFDQTSLKAEFREGIAAPFVKNSPVQLLCKYLNEYPIHENDTLHVILQIEGIWVDEKLLTQDHWIRLDQGEVVCINGLDGYALPRLLDRLEYARPFKTQKSLL